MITDDSGFGKVVIKMERGKLDRLATSPQPLTGLVDNRLPSEQIGEVPPNFAKKKVHHKFSREVNSQIAELKQLDNWHGLLALLEDCGVISVAIGLSLNFPGFYPVALVLIGSRMRALATLLHESSHRVLAANWLLNDLIGYLGAYSILQIPVAYYESHTLDHHRYLGDINRDPDLKFHVGEGMYEPMSPSAFFLRYILAPALLFRVPKTLCYLLKDRFLNPFTGV
jgi:fatty acid desaturase